MGGQVVFSLEILHYGLKFTQPPTVHPGWVVLLKDTENNGIFGVF